MISGHSDPLDALRRVIREGYLQHVNGKTERVCYFCSAVLPAHLNQCEGQAALARVEQETASMNENTQAPVPSDHPLMKAWEAYKATADYANTRKWALTIPSHTYIDGSLWAAFERGWRVACSPGGTPQEARLDLEAGERRQRVEQFLERRRKGNNDHIRAYTYLETLAALESFAASEVERLRSPGAGEARLRVLALAHAQEAHKTLHGQFEHTGGRFEECTHPDCVLVRAGLVPAQEQQK